MGKNEIALEITLALIGNSLVRTGPDNASTGKLISDLYNAIHQNIQCEDE